MSYITLPSDMSQYTTREILTSSKTSANISTIINDIIDQHENLNAGLENLIRGSDYADQGKITFILASAPTGWTRVEDTTNDSLLRTDTNGGVVAGNWIMTSTISSAENMSHAHTLQAHTHILNDHQHTVSHNHTLGGSHSHTIGSHTHYIANDATPSGWQTFEAGWFAGANFGYDHWNHQHTVNHGHTNATVSNTGTTDSSEVGNTTVKTLSLTTQSTTASGGPSTDATDTVVNNHSHTVQSDDYWRPRYLNVILCSKD